MAFTSPHAPETHQGVLELLRDSDLSMAAIAEQSGVPFATVSLWNRNARIRPWTRAGRLEANPRYWTAGRVRAAARLLGRGDLDPGDLAEALGLKRNDATVLMLACGLAAAKAPAKLAPPGEAPDLTDLGAALRSHIARQIAAFDESLSRAGTTADSAKVLRDLGGLKRLLDDLSASARQPDANGDADGESPQDLAALRERIARRYEAFEAERRHAGLSGEPGTGAPGEAGA